MVLHVVHVVYHGRVAAAAAAAAALLAQFASLPWTYVDVRARTKSRQKFFNCCTKRGSEKEITARCLPEPINRHRHSLHIHDIHVHVHVLAGTCSGRVERKGSGGGTSPQETVVDR